MILTTVSSTLADIVTQKLCGDLEQVNRILKRHYPEPTLSYKQRGSIAGSAHVLTWTIRLNPILLNENSTSFVQEVIPHELAHLIVSREYGHVAPHGKEWQYVMEVVLKVPAIRCHSFDLSSIPKRLFDYRCLCQNHTLTLRQHNQVQKKQRNYFCKFCKQRLLPRN